MPGSFVPLAIASASSLRASRRSASSSSSRRTETSMLRSQTWWSTASAGSAAMASTSESTSTGSAARPNSNPIPAIDSTHASHARARAIGSFADRARSAASWAAGRRADPIPERPLGRALEERDVGGERIGRPVDELPGALGPGRGVLVGDAPHRLLAGGDGAGEPLGAVDEGAGGQEVVGDLAGRHLRSGGDGEGPADAPVEVVEAQAAEARQHGVAREGVRRHQAPGAGLAQQPGGDGDVGGVEHLVGVELRGGHEHGERRQLAGHRGEADDLGARRRQAVEPRVDHRADRVRQLARPAVDAAADQLADEERVAVRGRQQVGGQRVRSPGQAQEGPDVVDVERPDVDARQLAVADEAHQQAIDVGPGVLARDPLRGQDHHPARSLVAHEVLDELHGRAVGPLHVVDDEQDRQARRLDRQQVGDGLEQDVALDVGRRALDAHRRDELGQLRAAARRARCGRR